jgi:hypothetical protein
VQVKKRKKSEREQKNFSKLGSKKLGSKKLGEKIFLLMLTVRPQSAVSTAATVDDIPYDESDEVFYIKAFSMFTCMSIILEYPSEHNGWVYRPELSGNSQHRWDLKGSVSIVVRHSTCKKAIIRRGLCRNCIMKSVWRRECSLPCNTFYVRPIGTGTGHYFDGILNPLVYDSKTLTQEEINLYMMHMPKERSIPRFNSEEEYILKDARMRKLERSLRSSLLNKGGAIRLNDGRGPSVLDLISSYLNKSDSGTEFAEPALLPDTSTAPTDAIVVSPVRVDSKAVGPPLSPLTIRAKAVTAARRPASQADMRNTYSALLPLIQKPFTINNLRAIRASCRCDPPFHMIGELAALDAISKGLGGERATLVIPPRLESWLERLETTTSNGRLSINLGVTNPMNDTVRHDIMMGTSSSGLASVVVNPAYLRTFSDAIIVAYPPCSSIFAVPIASILPLGVIWNEVVT